MDQHRACHLELHRGCLRRFARAIRPRSLSQRRAIVTQGRNNPNTKLSGGIGVDDPLILGKSLADGAIADFRIVDRVVTEAEARLLADWPIPKATATACSAISFCANSSRTAR